MIKLINKIVLLTIIVTSCSTRTVVLEDNNANLDDNATMIVLAYPEEIVRSTESLYSNLLPIVGMGRQGFIRAGHACVIILSDDSDEFEYFYFGRYIAPEGFGRARSKETDPEILMSYFAGSMTIPKRHEAMAICTPQLVNG